MDHQINFIPQMLFVFLQYLNMKRKKPVLGNGIEKCISARALFIFYFLISIWVIIINHHQFAIFKNTIKPLKMILQ